MTAFDKQWWLEHGATYVDEFKRSPAFEAQELELRELLMQMPAVCDSVVEIGCGFGRITNIVHDTLRPLCYVATDVSPEALVKAREYIGDRNIELQHFDLDIGGHRSKAYELLIAAEVLMHRTPEQIGRDVKQLVAMASKYIVNVDWYEPGARAAAGCYQHEYDSLFAPYGTVTRIEVPAARQAIWLTELEDNHGADH